MLNLLELAQFVSFAECGTLSKAAEQLHISQPTLTRTMRHMEDVFGVPLFHRGKNHLALNQTGEISAFRKAIRWRGCPAPPWRN